MGGDAGWTARTDVFPEGFFTRTGGNVNKQGVTVSGKVCVGNRRPLDRVCELRWGEGA